ncbi:hypothetical protein COLO4_33892 [Corchorus olitorius]|uniref:Uncharacterized protein n=1 Tax=Corchorus olitorius TaxID=93759 RepID=A0A1R3GQ50_9ROSI|nr:hypothetical protein COLO4_33892 [Corchorus olitorius]
MLVGQEWLKMLVVGQVVEATMLMAQIRMLKLTKKGKRVHSCLQMSSTALLKLIVKIRRQMMLKDASQVAYISGLMDLYQSSLKIRFSLGLLNSKQH